MQEGKWNKVPFLCSRLPCTAADFAQQASKLLLSAPSSEVLSWQSADLAEKPETPKCSSCITRLQNGVLRMKKYLSFKQSLSKYERFLLLGMCWITKTTLKKAGCEKQFWRQEALCFRGQRSIKSLVFTCPLSGFHRKCHDSEIDKKISFAAPAVWVCGSFLLLVFLTGEVQVVVSLPRSVAQWDEGFGVLEDYK